MLIPTNVDALVLVEHSPTVFHGEVSFTAGIDTLVLTEYNAAVGLSIPVTAGVDAFVIAEYNPVVDFINIAVSVDALVIATFNPVIIVGINVSAGLDRLFIAVYSSEVTITLPSLTSELSFSSLMKKELKARSEMNL